MTCLLLRPSLVFQHPEAGLTAEKGGSEGICDCLCCRINQTQPSKRTYVVTMAIQFMSSIVESNQFRYIVYKTCFLGLDRSPKRRRSWQGMEVGEDALAGGLGLQVGVEWIVKTVRFQLTCHMRQTVFE